MNKELLISDIRQYCRNNQNESNILKYSRYFKEGLYNGWGLTNAMMESKSKNLLASEEISLPLVMDAAPELLKSGKYDEIGIMLLLVKYLHRHYSYEHFKEIENWYTYSIYNWAHADFLGMYLLPVFVKKGIVQLPDFKKWLNAENKYQRRSVPVTLIKSLKTHQQYDELFAFIECLMTDPEREVHQGTGWFLREAWKKKPVETERFLLKWKDISPRLIIQYATEKMTVEQKQLFKRVKK